jgi:hypothetical protein
MAYEQKALPPGFIDPFVPTVATKPPCAFVRVIATRECIVALDPTGAIDHANALDVAQGDRMRIETAASKKYDAEGEDPVSGELILGASDLP